jgi:hypothetical protein
MSANAKLRRRCLASDQILLSLIQDFNLHDTSLRISTLAVSQFSNRAFPSEIR